MVNKIKLLPPPNKNEDRFLPGKWHCDADRYSPRMATFTEFNCIKVTFTMEGASVNFLDVLDVLEARKS